jgi:hypothetical protein
MEAEFDLIEYIKTQQRWSTKTFGEGRRTEGVVKHIEKELAEIRAKPTDIMEWIDVLILALDGAWRAGFTPEIITQALSPKQAININRKWPAPTSEDQPVEHVRDAA